MSERQPLLRGDGRPSQFFSGMMIALLVAGQVAQGLSIPLWYLRLPTDSCIDIFVTFLIMIVWYPLMFFVTAVVAHAAQGRSPLAFLTKYDRSDHWLILKTGLCDALNGALVIPASPSVRTPPVVGALIGCTTLLPLIVIKHVYLGVSLSSSWVHYKSGTFLLVLLLYSAAAYTIVYPTVLHNEHIGHQFYNVQQEKFFKYLPQKHEKFCDYIGYLFWQTFYLMLWGFSFIWMDLIPHFGQATDATSLRCNLADTLKHSFEQPAFIYNFLFNFGYYVTYIAACFVNHTDALVGTVASVLVTCIVTIVSYPIKELTPDKHVISIGLVPLTIVLSAASMYTYMKWTKEAGIYHVTPKTRMAINN